MTQDGRLSLQGQQDRSKKICMKAEASQRQRRRRVSDKGGGESATKAEASQRQRRRRVSDKGGGESATKAEASQRRSLKVTTYPSPQRSKWESSSGFLRESPLDKCLRESLSGKE